MHSLLSLHPVKCFRASPWLHVCMSAANARALLLCFHGLREEHIISYFLSLLVILWLISLSQLLCRLAPHSVWVCRAPKPLPNSGIPLGVDFLVPVELLFSFLQCVVSRGVAGCRLKFL